jgi:tripartite-type tricarboxylate transporter receptor subunit TctC
VEAMAMPEVKEAMARQGNDIDVSTPEAATRFIREEIDKYARLARKAQMQLD